MPVPVEDRFVRLFSALNKLPKVNNTNNENSFVEKETTSLKGNDSLVNRPRRQKNSNHINSDNRTNLSNKAAPSPSNASAVNIIFSPDIKYTRVSSPARKDTKSPWLFHIEQAPLQMEKKKVNNKKLDIDRISKLAQPKKPLPLCKNRIIKQVSNEKNISSKSGLNYKIFLKKNEKELNNLSCNNSETISKDHIDKSPLTNKKSVNNDSLKIIQNEPQNESKNQSNLKSKATEISANVNTNYIARSLSLVVAKEKQSGERNKTSNLNVKKSINVPKSSLSKSIYSIKSLPDKILTSDIRNKNTQSIVRYKKTPINEVSTSSKSYNICNINHSKNKAQISNINLYSNNSSYGKGQLQKCKTTSKKILSLEDQSNIPDISIIPEICLDSTETKVDDRNIKLQDNISEPEPNKCLLTPRVETHFKLLHEIAVESLTNAEIIRPIDIKQIIKSTQCRRKKRKSKHRNIFKVNKNSNSKTHRERSSNKYYKKNLKRFSSGFVSYDSDNEYSYSYSALTSSSSAISLHRSPKVCGDNIQSVIKKRSQLGKANAYYKHVVPSKEENLNINQRKPLMSYYNQPRTDSYMFSNNLVSIKPSSFAMQSDFCRNHLQENDSDLEKKINRVNTQISKAKNSFSCGKSYMERYPSEVQSRFPYSNYTETTSKDFSSPDKQNNLPIANTNSKPNRLNTYPKVNLSTNSNKSIETTKNSGDLKSTMPKQSLYDKYIYKYNDLYKEAKLKRTNNGKSHIRYSNIQNSIRPDKQTINKESEKQKVQLELSNNKSKVPDKNTRSSIISKSHDQLCYERTTLDSSNVNPKELSSKAYESQSEQYFHNHDNLLSYEEIFCSNTSSAPNSPTESELYKNQSRNPSNENNFSNLALYTSKYYKRNNKSNNVDLCSSYITKNTVENMSIEKTRSISSVSGNGRKRNDSTIKKKSTKIQNPILKKQTKIFKKELGMTSSVVNLEGSQNINNTDTYKGYTNNNVESYSKSSLDLFSDRKSTNSMNPDDCFNKYHIVNPQHQQSVSCGHINSIEYDFVHINCKKKKALDRVSKILIESGVKLEDVLDHNELIQIKNTKCY